MAKLTKSAKPTYLNFDKESYAWKSTIDYRKQPELYKIGKGEQGVLICEPYKSEIGMHWRFKTPQIALNSSRTILNLFYEYLEKNDFVGADMARKYLQMGFTRSRRYANYKGGKKYDKKNNYSQLDKGTGDNNKIKCAEIFYKAWKKAESCLAYQTMKNEWKKQCG